MEPATKLVIMVSIHFMILFTAFTAFQTIVTRIHEEEGDRSLGPFIFAVNYFAFVISNLFVSRVRFSEKWQITLATLTYAFNYMTGFLISGTPVYVKYMVAALGATVNGFGASFLWTGLGSYIHQVCHLHNKVSEKGHYYGLFQTIYCFSSVLGAIVVTFGLSMFSHTVYFMIVTGVAMVAFFFGMIFIKDIKVSDQATK